ncbi:MAG TPA: ferric reductase-like transmembrane domain-containing protein [Gryllotalpicola sp.]
MFDDTMWAFGRGSGIADLALLTVSLVAGILTRSGRPLPGVPRFALSLIHRNAALLAVAFLALHVGTLLIDPFAKLTLVDVVVPFLGADNPFWLGMGTLAVDLLIAIVVTALTRQVIGARAFKAVHWLAYAMWPVAMLHGVFEGTDGTDAWFLAGASAATLLVAGAVLWRLSPRFQETPRRTTAAARPAALTEPQVWRAP